MVNSVISTVNQLIEALKQFPQDAKLAVSGADCGGYDVTWQPEVELQLTSGDEFLEPGLILSINGVDSNGKDWWDLKRVNECKRDGHQWENYHQHPTFVTENCRFLTRCRKCGTVDESGTINYRLRGKSASKEQYDAFEGPKYDH